ncbi:MAG: hypothetical protein K0R73_532 [Candidatus Midichloriaceae bacterium]|jgi:hypothetical protein|nr:hypothetical protein [Candidatus Midichloriaceae bacterium]
MKSAIVNQYIESISPDPHLHPVYASHAIKTKDMLDSLLCKAIINLLHSNNLVELDPDLLKFVNDGSGNHSWGAIIGVTEIPKFPAEIKLVMQEQYLNPLYDYALDKVFDHSLKTIIGKYKFTDEKQINNVKNILAGLYIEAQNQVCDLDHLNELGTLLLASFINNRLNKYCTEDQLNVFKANAGKYQTILSAKDKTLFVEELKKDLGLSEEHAIKVGRSFDKFSYTDSDANHILHKLQSDIRNSLEILIDEERSNLIGMKQHIFEGTEVLWRGVRTHDHITLRGGVAYNGYGLEDIMSQDLIDVCTSGGIRTPQSYASPYLIQILPSKGDKATFLHDNYLWHGLGSIEVDLNVYNEKIYKVYKISNLNVQEDAPSKFIVEDVYSNVHFIKQDTRIADVIEFQKGDIVTVNDFYADPQKSLQEFEAFEINRNGEVIEHKFSSTPLYTHFLEAGKKFLELCPETLDFTDEDAFDNFVSEQEREETVNLSLQKVPAEKIIALREANYEPMTYKISEINELVTPTFDEVFYG